MRHSEIGRSMATRVTGKKDRLVIDLVFIAVTIIMVMIISIYLQNNFATAAQSNQVQQTPVQNEIVKKNIMVNVSGGLNNLKSKEWTKLAEHIGRQRATTLLWYYLKTTYDIDAKIVFGSPKELDTAIAVKEPSWGDTPFPTVNIKGVRYYIIDPMAPAIVSDFKYGEMFDDPGKTYLPYNYFRLFPEDIDTVKQWTKETGVDIRHTDILGR
ncbi:Uncharacterised protein [uncultured archaeon]|nr:Uncharacterised protein [uncultured archaeon]